MSKNFCKFLSVLLSLLFLFGLLSACGSLDVGNSSNDSTMTSSEEKPTEEIKKPQPFILENMPEIDVSFIPDEITLTQEQINKYSFTPKIYDGMPRIYINTDDGSNAFATDFNRSDKLLDNIDYVSATISTDCDDESLILNDVEASVKVRGNYTLNYDKKPIRIKFDKKQSMLGLHNGEKYKNWVLLADWKDLSMQNNMLAFYLGNAILGSDGYYCTDFRNVELYLNGEYWGVYLIVEQQEVKDGRFSATEVEDDYEGTDIGYMFEFDGYYVQENNMPDGSGDPTFTIDHYNMPYDQPGYTVKSDIYSPDQWNFLSNYVQNVYNIMYSATQTQRYMGFNDDYTDVIDGKYMTSQEAISSCVDVQSLVDTYILNEIACDLDVDWSSFYLSLDMTESGCKKLVFEGPWDFDSSFGIIKKINTYQKMYARDSLNPWFNLLANEQWFKELVKQKWNELKQAGVLDNALKLSVYHKVTFEEYYNRNYEKWTKRVTGGNNEVVSEINTYTTQAQAADYQYRWLKSRLLYLDSQWKLIDINNKNPLEI